MGRELAGVDYVLRKCAKTQGVKGLLLRNDLLRKIKRCDGELSNVLEAVLVRGLFFEMYLVCLTSLFVA